MIVYKRNNKIRLLLLRGVFLVAAGGSIALFFYKRDDYGFVISFFLALASIIPITRLIIEEDSFIVVQYYMFGLISRKHVFSKGDKISIYEVDVTFSESDLSYLISGSLLDLLFIPSSLGKIKRYGIEWKDHYGNTKEFKMKLSEKEYLLINNNFLSRPSSYIDRTRVD